MPLIVRLRSIDASTTAFSPIETLLKKPQIPQKLRVWAGKYTGLFFFFFYLELDGMKPTEEIKKYDPYWHHIHRREAPSLSDTAQCCSLLHPHAAFDRERESMRAKSWHSHGLCSLEQQGLLGIIQLKHEREAGVTLCSLAERVVGMSGWYLQAHWQGPSVPIVSVCALWEAVGTKLWTAKAQAGYCLCGLIPPLFQGTNKEFLLFNRVRSTL